MSRLLDLVLAALALLLLSPLLALAVLAIRIEGGGPVIYRQRRVGKDGEVFELLKLRTMVAGSDPVGVGTAVTRDDPRVTHAGRILRRFSIDEVPQVLNVLRGEMSLVGPRPLPVRDYERLEEWHRKRYLVLPGMTGLWQISGRSNLAFDDLVRLDFYYLETWSVWLDISILLKTIPAVLMRRGAY